MNVEKYLAGSIVATVVSFNGVVDELKNHLGRRRGSHDFRVDLELGIRLVVSGGLHLPPNLSCRFGSVVKGVEFNVDRFDVSKQSRTSFF